MALPPITLNSQFKDDFTEADAPCCALGLVRSGDTQTGLFAMKHRGRELGCPGPPAQIRTCALTHPAPTLQNPGTLEQGILGT